MAQKRRYVGENGRACPRNEGWKGTQVFCFCALFEVKTRKERIESREEEERFMQTLFDWPCLM